MMTRTMIARAALAAGLAGLCVSPAAAQQTSVSALASQGFEVKALTTFDIDPADASDEESVFVIMQNGADVYGCVLQSSTTSFCQRIE